MDKLCASVLKKVPGFSDFLASLSGFFWRGMLAALDRDGGASLAVGLSRLRGRGRGRPQALRRHRGGRAQPEVQD